MHTYNLNDAIAASLLTLQDTVARAMADITTACKDLENGQPRAAAGALVPVSQKLDEARALQAAILILCRELT